MSARRRPRTAEVRPLRAYAPVFFALGDRTRLALVSKLADGTALSISELAEGGAITRQAITRHLRVLERAGVVRSIRRGRENLHQLDPAALEEARRALAEISRHWDDALERLRVFLESDPG